MAEEMRPCGGSWAYCDGSCKTCLRANLTTNSNISVISTATVCMVCGEEVPLPYGDRGPKVCDKCKAAVMKVRQGMEDPCREILD